MVNCVAEVERCFPPVDRVALINCTRSDTHCIIQRRFQGVVSRYPHHSLLLFAHRYEKDLSHSWADIIICKLCVIRCFMHKRTRTRWPPGCWIAKKENGSTSLKRKILKHLISHGCAKRAITSGVTGYLSLDPKLCALLPVMWLSEFKMYVAHD